MKSVPLYGIEDGVAMTISKNKGLLILLLFPFLELSIRHIPFYGELAWKAIPGILGILLFCLTLKAEKITKVRILSQPKSQFILLIVGYSLSLLFSGYYNGNLSIGVWYTYLLYLGVFFYLDTWMDDFKAFLTVINGMFMALIILSFGLMIVYPVKAFVSLGGSRCFVGALGDKNAVQMTIMPAIAMFFLEMYTTHSKKRYILWFFILLAILFLFLSKSGTSIIAATLLVTYVLLGRKLKISFKFLGLVYLILFSGIVLFRVQEKWFYDLIVEVLHKDITLSDRTFIWDVSLDSIKKAPLIGYGPKNTIVRTYYLYAAESHNGLLEILLAGGCISLTFFMGIMALVGKQLDHYREYPMAAVLIFFLFLYSFICLTESGFGYGKVLFWMMMIISMNIDKIIQQTQEEKQ